MATAGLVFLVVAFAASIIAVVSLLVSHVKGEGGVVFARIGHASVIATFASLLICCGILVFCFMTGDVSIQYVLEERSLSTDGMAWLYKLAGLWAGRAGSLLFWTFLIALFNTLIMVGRSSRKSASLDNLAMMVVSVVVAVFCGLLLFSEGNMPFVPTPAEYFDADGSLVFGTMLYSMNPLLEHWAMAIHPPMLFIGYAGLTVPFAFAVATLILGDASKLWVERATRYVIASWLFLGIGIGLGAVWAYVVLGWGGYWGWDPVENASLLSWLVCVALVHTFTVYRQRGAFKRWGVLCACLAFTFVIVATFITRSGIVQSVHAFAGDPVSLALFGGLIVVSLAVPIVGIAIRWKVFASDNEGGDDIENMLSKDAAYYFNNVIMVVFTLVLTYMTVASALPSWLPFGGASLGTTSYEAIARPLGIFYLLILAVCPLLAWGRTDPKKLLKQARIPSVCTIVLFVLLVLWWSQEFLPVYDETLAKGGSAAQTLLEGGPGWYYNGLAVVGFFVASLLFFNAAFMVVRSVKAPSKRASAIGGSIAHVAMAVILIGLIGSNMYVYEESGYMKHDEATESFEPFDVREYRLEYAGDDAAENSGTGQTLYAVDFDVYKNDAYVGTVRPSVLDNSATQQQKYNAAVLTFPEEDLFVVFRGVNANYDLTLDVRVNQFILFVWLGFALLMVGTAIALVGRRGFTPAVGASSSSPTEQDDDAEGDAR